jgi:NitT/TauT family transport system ATP-binding protein
VSPDPIITLRGVDKTFVSAQQQPVEALRGVSLDVRRDAFVALVGPSGCGKTTIINLIAGFAQPTSGSVCYKNRPVAGVNRDVGYVPQESKLFPWLSLEQNILFPLQVRGYPRQEQQARLREYLALVGLTGFERALPSQLSGGMQKRASIIRALVYDADVLLMDEPFGPLDAQTKMVLQSDLLRLWSQRPKTVLFVTHDLVEAIALSDQIVVLTPRPGEVRAVLDVPLARPRDVYRIHEQPGFAAIYERLWALFRDELLTDDGTPLDATAATGSHSAAASIAREPR